jgi:glycogen debranching enzyme
MNDFTLEQQPEPGRHLLKIRGDSIDFTLRLSEEQAGTAWVRTNLGQARTIRKEIMRGVTHDEPMLGRDWYDIPMAAQSEKSFQLTLGLTEVGHFEAKCFFLPDGEFTPVWPPGDNVSVNVAPTDTCCANTIYNAFVRQFGPNKDGSFRTPEEQAAAIQTLDQSGYTVIPPSGTFRDLIAELDFIIDHLGCRFIQLLPVNPTPTTYGRMGRFGSPYASLDFTSIDPALAEFDPKATPLEQFIELVDAVHARGAKLLLDIAPNHTGWAAELHETNPEWLVRDDTGHIEAPGAWGVTWADLARLDYRHKDLWAYMGEVFLAWSRRGIDGFRCDAGYMIPVEAWMYIIAVVREQFPETVFLLEGLGGKLSVTRQLLNRAGFDWAYSELFQNYNRAEIEHYLPETCRISGEDGLMVHFAETHDNNRLAATSRRFAAMRTALCALASPHGGFGFANGVEWFADEKIDVHDARSLNWGSPVNQVALIRRINILLKTHPAFFDQSEIQMIQAGEANALVFLRRHPPTGKRLLAAVNLDCENPSRVLWPPEAAGMEETAYRDLLADQRVSAEKAGGGLLSLAMEPGAVFCLSPETDAVPVRENPEIPERIARQRLRAAALEVFRAFRGTSHLGGLDLDAAASRLAADPEAFCRQMNPEGDAPCVVPWHWPADCRREVMIPHGHFLMISAEAPFRARVVESARKRETTRWVADSLQADSGASFALIPPLGAIPYPARRTLKLSIFEADTCHHAEASLLYLGPPEEVCVHRGFGRALMKKESLLFLGANSRGSMMRAHAAWPHIESKYDGLLAANLNPDYPDDRQMMLVRFRAWLVFQGFSQALSLDCQQQFRIEGRNRCSWHFTVPCGQGQHVGLCFKTELADGGNRVTISLTREAAGAAPDRLPDSRPVKLILRPDIDDRNFHENTKAYLGPEHEWPGRCSPMAGGVTFQPRPGRMLSITGAVSEFVPEPEWQYMVYLPVEESRGMDPHTDLFSPGYFTLYLNGGETERLCAAVNPGKEEAAPEDAAQPPPPAEPSFADALKEALKAYIVRREKLHTVIAGYPWFLDWGRDTLIAVRGLIAAGYQSEAETILTQFAGFEEMGTLPNMIRGSDAGNRDTSDAPLWFFVAVSDLLEAAGSDRFLETDCGGRSLLEILRSIARGYIRGTPNGIRMDRDSALIYSPAHFTWMDTNHPAGTPRQGYPIEIQALWHSALSFLAGIDSAEADWQELAQQARQGIESRFLLPDLPYFSDCLHAGPDMPAAQARPDDALRPNQLFAATLGAVSGERPIRAMLASCMELLVPGALRSLADRQVQYPIPVEHHGRLLNDPHHPYQGVYAGDEDTRRKPAYHNGTAWTWLLPSFCEAWALAYGAAGKKAALSWLSSSSLLLNAGCVGQIPEILDGDAPHPQRGCGAQAWGVSELLRVWLKLRSRA